MTETTAMSAAANKKLMEKIFAAVTAGDRTLYTDANGEVIFNFTDDFKLGQAGFAVLMLEANSEDELLHAEGIIKVEEEKINEETLVIQPF